LEKLNTKSFKDHRKRTVELLEVLGEKTDNKWEVYVGKARSFNRGGTGKYM